MGGPLWVQENQGRPESGLGLGPLPSQYLKDCRLLSFSLYSSCPKQCSLFIHSANTH